MSAEKLYFIFDFDGVIGDTFDACNQAKVDQGLARDLADAVKTTIEYNSGRPSHSRNYSKEEIAYYHNWTKKFCAGMSKQNFDLFWDFVNSVKKIDPEKAAIVSSGATSYVTKKSLESGLELTHVLAFEDHHSKEEKVENITSDWEVDISRVYYFTDSIQDVYELENIMDKTKIIGCGWGYLGKEALLQVLPNEQILENETDVLEMFL
jgi:hypothetical protein